MMFDHHLGLVVAEAVTIYPWRTKCYLYQVYNKHKWIRFVTRIVQISAPLLQMEPCSDAREI
jgi:hypothetical protein